MTPGDWRQKGVSIMAVLVSVTTEGLRSLKELNPPLGLVAFYTA